MILVCRFYFSLSDLSETSLRFLQVPYCYSISWFWGDVILRGFILSVLYFTILYKPQCYSRIPSPEKSCNNTLKKYDNFSRVWYRNQLLTRHLLLAPVGQDDEWMAKPSSFFIQGCLLEFFHVMAVKTLRNLYGLRKVIFKLSWGGGRKAKYNFFL